MLLTTKRSINCTLHFLVVLLLLQEMVPEMEAARVRVVKVKKTRHDKRQTPARGGYSTEVIGQAYDDSSNLKPEDNPYNAGNRKVDYPLRTPNNQRNSNKEDRNFQQPQENLGTRRSPQQQPPRQTGGSKIYEDGSDHCDGCGNGIPGVAGTDYPIYTAPPKTNFDCKKQQWPGYYADTESQCQVFWICQKNRADSFVCPNGTLFNQQVFVCDWWFNVDCGTAPEYYSRNQYIYAGPGVDIFGNAIPIGNRESTPVQVGNINRNPRPTYEPIQTHIPPTNQPPYNPRPNSNSFQASIPIIQSTLPPSPPKQGSNYNRRATPTQSSRINKIYEPYSEKTPTNDFQVPILKTDDETSDTVAYRQTITPPANTRNGSPVYNPEYDPHEVLERTERRPELPEPRNSNSDNSYANYIEAQKRLHLGVNYKPKKQAGNENGGSSYRLNPLISTQPQPKVYRDDVTPKYVPVQTTSKYSAYDNSRSNSPANNAYLVTTKRNAVVPENLEETSNFPLDDDDISGHNFNFVKMLLPSTTPPTSTVLKRPTSYKKLGYEPVSTPVPHDGSEFVPPTTPVPFSRLIKITDLDKDQRQSASDDTSTLHVASSSHYQPSPYVQVVAPVTRDYDAVPTTPRTPTFGKKIKSGKKRNTSDWTSYFSNKTKN